MAEFKQASADAPVAEKALTWIDNRFPLSKLWNDQWAEHLDGFEIDEPLRHDRTPVLGRCHGCHLRALSAAASQLGAQPLVGHGKGPGGGARDHALGDRGVGP